MADHARMITIFRGKTFLTIAAADAYLLQMLDHTRATGRREGLEEAATIAKNSAWTDDSCGEYESGWDAGCNQVAMNIRSRMEEKP